VNFDFSADQESLRQTARSFLEEHASLRVCRAVLESDQPYARELWKSAAALGWLGASVPEEYGGAGMGYLELAVLAEEMGRALAPIPFSTSVYLATEALILAGSPEQQRKYLPRLAAGEAVGSLALAEGVGRSGVANVSTRFEGGVLTGTKLPVLDGAAADFAVVSARSREGVSLVLVDLDAGGVEVEALRSFDPSRSLAKLRFAEAPGDLLGVQGQGVALVEQVLDRAAVLLAFEQLGGAARATPSGGRSLRSRRSSTALPISGARSSWRARTATTVPGPCPTTTRTWASRPASPMSPHRVRSRGWQRR
jgi:alkylation response protein AidB-like acyl-CoA dehydrogenase